MPRKCCVCSVEDSQFDNRSFHLFPKNESLRQKWIEAVNLTKPVNLKYTYMCGIHFDDKYFFEIDANRKKKRLRPEAIPYNINKNTSQNVLNENEPSNEPVSKKIVDEESFVQQVKDVVLNEEFPEHLESVVDKESLSHDHTDFHNHDDVYLNEKSSKFESSNVQKSDCDAKRKRKSTSVSGNSPPKKIRFMNSTKTEYISREDFVSDEAWNKFLRFLAYEKRTVAAGRIENIFKMFTLRSNS
ncbi:uncharacterized protein LOC116849388 [Odontomachus brunneus]|uniref:uncharacterized protein LOC116849388 n=1 Tax=Odontomachus brunneus TaxID=486640 RepID=UPI0013F2488D|nr:uncharacterized protein LOC116849388 [Odontomachus brunneus]